MQAPSKFASWYIQNISLKWGMRIVHLLTKISPNLVRQSATVSYRDCKFHVYTGEEVGRRLYFLGSYEPAQEDCFLSVLPPHAKMFDIGANIGIYSLLAAKAGATVHAFEPSRRAMELLKENISQNGLVGKIQVHPIAVSDSAGRLSFFEGNDANWAVGRIFSYGKNAVKAGHEVETESLDALVKRLGKPDVIKMDIEGAEWLVFKGAQETFGARDAPVIFMEVHAPQIKHLGGSAETLVRGLRQFGYRQFQMKDRDPKAPQDWFIFSKESLHSPRVEEIFHSS